MIEDSNGINIPGPGENPGERKTVPFTPAMTPEQKAQFDRIKNNPAFRQQMEDNEKMQRMGRIQSMKNDFAMTMAVLWFQFYCQQSGDADKTAKDTIDQWVTNVMRSAAQFPPEIQNKIQEEIRDVLKEINRRMGAPAEESEVPPPAPSVDRQGEVT